MKRIKVATAVTALRCASALSLMLIALMVLACSIVQAELEKGRILYLPLNGNAKDFSGNGNDGTVKGAKWVWVNAEAGSALSFDGEDDYVEVPSSESLSPTEQVTIAVWVNPADKEPPGADPIVRKDGAYILQITGYGEFVFAVWIGGNAANWRDCVVPKDDWEIGKWYHVAGVFNGEEYKIYLNGTLKQSTAVGGRIDTNDEPLLLGRHPLWIEDPGFYHGLIDDVQVWNRALTEEEIKQSMIHELSVVPPARTLTTTWGTLKAQ